MAKVIQRIDQENGIKNMTIECSCGTKIELVDWWATSCSNCNREYNGGGQELAPRSQWGEETGEKFY